MPLKYYLSGRERVLSKAATITLPQTLVYNTDSCAFFDFVWFADSSTCTIPAFIRPSTRTHSTIVPGSTDPLLQNVLEYGALIGDGAGTWVKFGEIPAPCGTVYTDFANTNKWSVFRFNIVAFYDETADRIEVIEGAGGAFPERIKPGTRTYARTDLAGTVVYGYDITAGGSDYEQVGTASDMLALSVGLSGVSQQGFPTPTHAAPADVARFNAAGPLLSAGIIATCDMHYTNGPGLINPTTIPASGSLGSADWGVLNIGQANRANTRTGSLTCGGGSPFTLRVRGDIRRWASPNDLPTSVTVLADSRGNALLATPAEVSRTLTGVTGSFDTSFALGGYHLSATWQEGATTETRTANNFGADGSSTFNNGISVAAVAQAGGMAARWRTGRDLLTVQQAAETILEGAGGLSPWAVSPPPITGASDLTRWHQGSSDTVIALSVVGSGSSAVLKVLRLAGSVSSPPLTVSRYFNQAGTLNRRLGYRYVTVRWRSVGAANVALKFFFSPFSFPYYPTTTAGDGEWVERTIDIYGPGKDNTTGGFNRSAATDQLAYPGYMLQGFDGLPVGASVEIAWIKGNRKNESLFSVVFGRDEPLPISGVTDALRTWFGVSEVSTWTPGSIIPLPTIGQVADGIAARPWQGWTATPLHSEASDLAAALQYDPATGGTYYLPLNRMPDVGYLCSFLEAGGLHYDNTLSLDRHADAAPLTVQACPAWNTPLFLPGGGDAIAGTGYANTVEVRFSAIFGGQVVGALVPAKSSVSVNLKTPNTAEGSGSPSAGGFYATGPPYLPQIDRVTTKTYQIRAKDPITYRWPASVVFTPTDDTKQPVELAITSVGRRWWVRFNDIPSGMGPDSLSHPYLGYYAKAYQKDGAIWFRRTNRVGVPTSGTYLPAVTVRAAGNPLDGASIVLGTYGELRVLWHETVSGTTNVYESQSHDEGATWGNPVMVISGGSMARYGRPIANDLGRIPIVAFVPGTSGADTGTLQAVTINPDGATFSAPWTIQYNNSGTLANLPVKSSGHDLIQLYEGPGRWNLLVVMDGDTDFSEWQSSDDAHSFTRLA